MKKTVFLDRDGTINVEKNYLYKPEEFEFIPGAQHAIKRLNDNGYQVIVVSNQAGIARGYYSEQDVASLHAYVNEELQKIDAHIDGFYYCPHHPVAGIGFYKRMCNCRKPKIGLFEQACQDFPTDISNSYMIGDNQGDMEAGKNFGLKTILVSTGYGSKIHEEGKVAYDYYTKNLETAVDYILGASDKMPAEKKSSHSLDDMLNALGEELPEPKKHEKKSKRNKGLSQPEIAKKQRINAIQDEIPVYRHLSTLINRYPELKSCKPDIERTYILLKEMYENHGTLLVAGNGGSAADAEHIVGELMKSFVKKREMTAEFADKLREIHPEYGEELGKKLQGALPAIALTAQEGISTAYLNDVDGQLVYAQLVNGYGKAGDCFLGISTSGNSKNIMMAAITAKAKGMKVIALTGAGGGALKELADVTIRVPETETFKIQELHLPVYHALCLMLEEWFY